MLTENETLLRLKRDWEKYWKETFSLKLRIIFYTSLLWEQSFLPITKLGKKEILRLFSERQKKDLVICKSHDGDLMMTILATIISNHDFTQGAIHLLQTILSSSFALSPRQTGAPQRQLPSTHSHDLHDLFEEHSEKKVREHFNFLSPGSRQVRAYRDIY